MELLDIAGLSLNRWALGWNAGCGRGLFEDYDLGKEHKTQNPFIIYLIYNYR